jgi:hypothetical protein
LYSESLGRGTGRPVVAEATDEWLPVLSPLFHKTLDRTMKYLLDDWAS